MEPRHQYWSFHGVAKVGATVGDNFCLKFTGEWNRSADGSCRLVACKVEPPYLHFLGRTAFWIWVWEEQEQEAGGRKAGGDSVTKLVCYTCRESSHEWGRPA